MAYQESTIESPSLSPAPSSTTDRPRCEPDPLDPTSICTAKVTADDRQGISHFFGRNKKATHSIPDGIFPLLCRTHYQEKQYRWNDNVGALAAFQCDCVLKALERMASKTWTDEYGIEWPYWCGFELQTQKEPETENARSGKYNVPDWLRKLCSKEAAGQDFISVGDRGGARYDFLQLAKIVQSIKTWCMQNNTRLPNIEALPITIGMINEVELEEAKQGIRAATREQNLANTNLVRAERLKQKTNIAALRDALERAREAVELAETAFEIASEDTRSTRSTVPVRRLGRRGRTGTPETELMVDLEAEDSTLKRRRSESNMTSRKKLRMEYNEGDSV